MISTQNLESHTTQLARLSQWSQSYQKDFVAHGIATPNVPAVLTDGRLRCAENILRRLGTLNFEGGPTSGSREVVHLPNNVNNVLSLESIEEIKSAVIEWFDLTDDDIENILLYLNNKPKRSSDAIGRLPPRKSDPTKEPYPFVAGLDKVSALREAGEDYEEWVKAIIKMHPTLWDEEVKPGYLYQPPLVAIFIDQLLPKDKNCKGLLRRIFNIYQRLIGEKTICISLIEINDFLSRIRKYRLADPYKIGDTIRVYKNSSEDCYGFIRIFIGGTAQIIGSQQVEYTGEYCLLSRGQNGGKFFKIDLSSPDVLIVGPRDKLSPYINDSRFGKNIIFIENIPKAWPKVKNKESK